MKTYSDHGAWGTLGWGGASGDHQDRTSHPEFPQLTLVALSEEEEIAEHTSHLFFCSPFEQATHAPLGLPLPAGWPSFYVALNLGPPGPGTKIKHLFSPKSTHPWVTISITENGVMQE